MKERERKPTILHPKKWAIVPMNNNCANWLIRLKIVSVFATAYFGEDRRDWKTGFMIAHDILVRYLREDIL